ncbi:MAG: hypothetical protein ACYCST_12070 [Acidimicrobiales bacterium]
MQRLRPRRALGLDDDCLARVVHRSEVDATRQVLQINRQAAQQRFGDTQGGVMGRGDTSAFGAQAIEVVEAWRDHHWPELRDSFGADRPQLVCLEDPERRSAPPSDPNRVAATCHRSGHGA